MVNNGRVGLLTRAMADGAIIDFISTPLLAIVSTSWRLITIGLIERYSPLYYRFILLPRFGTCAYFRFFSPFLRRLLDFFQNSTTRQLPSYVLLSLRFQRPPPPARTAVSTRRSMQARMQHRSISFALMLFRRISVIII